MKRTPLIIAACLLAAILAVLLAIAAGLKREDPAPNLSVTQTTAASTTAPPETTATTTAPTTAPTTVPEVTAPAIHPDTVGIYIPADDGSKARVLVTEFSAPRTAKQDIDCFEIIASDTSRLEGSSFRTIWLDTWDSHPNTDGAKIGFHISFTLANGSRVDKVLLKPSDSREFYDYLEVYMYDDVHQTPGVWYTHLEDSNMDGETVITSIKLTAGSNISQVGDIFLTAFIYNGDACFDASGNYIGQVLQTIVITE